MCSFSSQGSSRDTRAQGFRGSQTGATRMNIRLKCVIARARSPSRRGDCSPVQMRTMLPRASGCIGALSWFEIQFCNSCCSSSLCYDVLQMRETLTISVPKRLRRDLEKMAKAEGVTSSEYVRRAIKADPFSSGAACGPARTRSTSARPRHLHG